MAKEFSILKNISHDRLHSACIIGFVGLMLLAFSIYINLVLPLDIILWITIVSLLGKVGEVLIITGFFIFILEHNTIDKFITKEISVSIIKDLFRFYFNKKEMMNLIFQLTKDLNISENINNDVLELYKTHGILELFNEPVREDLNIKYSYIKPFEKYPDLFIMQKYWGYRVVNSAIPDPKRNLDKKINKNGLVHSFSRIFYEDIPKSKEEIEEFLQKQLDIEFSYYNESTLGSTRVPLTPKFFESKEFDYLSGIPKIRTEKEFYTVYEIYADKPEINRLKISFYLNKPIMPGESIGIDLYYKSIFKTFDISILDFTSYTQGFNYDLKLGDEFETELAQQIIGKGHISSKSNNHLAYSGWILPHSSFSFAWSKKNDTDVHSNLVYDGDDMTSA